MNPADPDRRPRALAAADAAFVAALEACTLPKQAFDHRAHLRLAWSYLELHPLQQAERCMEDSIRRYAAHLGADRKYHRTITLAWMRLVAAARQQGASGGAGFDRFVAANPRLLDTRTLLAHYSAERLADPATRAAWTEPDLEPLPASVDSTAARTAAATAQPLEMAA